MEDNQTAILQEKPNEHFHMYIVIWNKQLIDS